MGMIQKPARSTPMRVICFPLYGIEVTPVIVFCSTNLLRRSCSRCIVGPSVSPGLEPGDFHEFWGSAMFKNLQVIALLLCTLPYAAAGTVAIGTASARGDIRIDRYTVNGNATLFDGSVVETEQATADLRLDKGVQITMSTRSRGTLYRDQIGRAH